MPQSIDAIAEELGAIVAGIERELRARFDAASSELRATIAELRAQMAEFETRAVRAETASAESISLRLAAIRGIEPTEVARMVDEAVARLPPPKPGPPGTSADPAEVARMVADAVASLPPPVNGRDADPAVIARMVAEAVAGLPPPAPGRDVDPVVVAGMVEKAVSAAVAALPPPAPGEPGPRGPVGFLPIAKAWTDAVHYAGDVVTHDGGTYQATRDTGRAPGHEDWTCLAAPGCDGASGADGKSFTVRGTWAPEAEYTALDVVAWNGAAFVARVDNPGGIPGDGWQLMSIQGRRGKAGEGTKGDPGPPGPAVVSASIGDDGVLVIRNADGSAITCDFYPLLSLMDRG